MEPGLLSRQERGQLWLRLGIRIVMTVGCILLFFFAVCPIVSFLMPFFLALLLAWALNPPVKWLKGKLPLSRRAISLVVLVLALGAVGGVCFALGWMLTGQVRSLFENWQAIVDGAFATLDAVGAWLNTLTETLPAALVRLEEELLDSAAGWVRGLDLSGQIRDMAGYTAGLVSAIPGFVMATIFFLMASYFITSDYPRMRFLVIDRMPEPLHRFGSQVRRLFIEAFGGYIKSQLILSGGVFVILAIGFMLIRQPYSLLLALGLAVLDFIPLIGSGTVLVPWAVIDVITANYTEAIQLMVIWGCIAVFRRVFEPKIIGDQTGLPPILSLLGIYAGMRIGGVVGMVLGPVLLLVAINLAKLGIFRPALNDLRLCARDLSALLRRGRSGEDGEPPGAS